VDSARSWAVERRRRLERVRVVAGSFSCVIF
jgi:hypothetical protein